MKKVLFLMLMAMPLFFASCSSDDEEDSISKSDLIGTWYTLIEDDFGAVSVFGETSIAQYNIFKVYGKYSLTTPETYKYSISGNEIISEDGEKVTIVSLDNKNLTITNGTNTLTYIKYDGTPQQLIEYLNK